MKEDTSFTRFTLRGGRGGRNHPPEEGRKAGQTLSPRKVALTKLPPFALQRSGRLGTRPSMGTYRPDSPRKDTMKTLLFLLCALTSLPVLAEDIVTATYSAEHRAGSMFFKATVREFRPSFGENWAALDVTYGNSYGNALCMPTSEGDRPLDVYLVFVLGEERFEVPATVSCRGWPYQATPHDRDFTWYDPRAHVYANTLSLKERFDRIFPARADGSRWYALKLGVRTVNGGLDNYGQFFPLVLEKQGE